MQHGLVRTGRLAALPLALAALVLLAAAPPARVARALEIEPAFRPAELIVEINPASGLTIESLADELSAAVASELAPEAATYLLHLPPDADVAALADRLDVDPRLDFAEPNYLAGAPEADPRGIGGWGGTDPAPLAGQPALAQIRMAESHAVSRGAGITVAVIDTGAQLDHPALASSLLAGRDFIDGDAMPTDAPDGLDDDGDGLADEAFGHGTHVAGIVHTIAPEARILVIRALTAEGVGDVFTVAQAIRSAADAGADVINLSLGAPAPSDVLRDAVVAASRAGAVVVAAAGNDASDDKQYPAAGSCAIAVASVGADDAASPFTNTGGWVSVAAPGESIFSTFPPGGYAWWSGTSMATPFVAGQAALLRSLQPALTPRAVAVLIGGTAVSLAGRNPQLRDDLGDGRIDLAASLAALSSGAELKAPASRISGSCVESDAP